MFSAAAKTCGVSGQSWSGWEGGGRRVGTMVSGRVSGSSSASRSEAFGPPGGGLGRHRGSEAGEVFRAAHVGSLRQEKHNVVTWQNTGLAPGEDYG